MEELRHRALSAGRGAHPNGRAARPADPPGGDRPRPPARVGATLGVLLENVKFEHTVFALPFAYIGMVLAAGGLPTLHQLVWASVAMAGARTCAMSLNRLIDREIDARNPRTRGRPLPSGRLSPSTVLLVAIAAAAVLAFAAGRLNDLALKLCPVALFFLVGYSYTKRFTWLAHWVLGVTDAAAPLGGWIAVRGSIDPPALLLFGAVALWVAGFDLLYACQDAEFDRAHGLHSVPACFGVPTALALARANHALTVALLAAVGLILQLGPLYWLGAALAAALLAYEHALVRPDDLSKLDQAFFNVNGYLAVAVFAFTLLDVLLA